MKKIFCYLVMIVLSACTLEENIKKEEGKDYQDVVHPVDMVDYEFEQRLNSFYESEPIKNEELYGLYEGEFPEDERNPTKLRIHWRDARELALAELELQRPIQAGWEEADISVRPILVLDRDGGDFYRYYEYRVVLEMRFLGAIRIPAYRRTENFATAEVHRYSDDEKTYTIHPTMWGQYIIDHSFISDNSLFFQKIEATITPFFSDNLVYNWMYRMYEYLEIEDDSLADPNKSHTLLKNFYNSRSSSIPKLKKTLSPSQLDSITENMTRTQLEDVHTVVNKVVSQIFITELIGLDIEFYRNTTISAHLISYSNFYQVANHYTLDSMIDNKNKRSSLQNILKNIVWQVVENEKSLDKLISYQWDFGVLFSENDIDPIIQYNNFDLYPQRNPNNNKYDLTISQYTLLTLDEHNNYFKFSSGLYNNPNHINIELYNNIDIVDGTVVEGIPNFVLEEALLLQNNTRIIAIINILLMPIKILLLEYIDSIIESVIDTVNGMLGDNINTIDVLYDVLKGLISKTPKDHPDYGGQQNLLGLLRIVKDNPENVATDVLSRMFGSWSVWVIPIFFFPTWVHYTDKWGPVPTWQMIMGWPNFWTLKTFPLTMPDLIIPNIPDFPKEVDTPKGLEKYPGEWTQVFEWVQNNGILDMDSNHEFIHASEDNIIYIMAKIEDLVKDVYISKISIDYKTGEPIINPTKQQLDQGLEESLNNYGSEFIRDKIPLMTRLSEFIFEIE